MIQTPQSFPSPDQMQDILDIEGLIRFPWDKLFHWILLVLLLALIAGLAIIFYKWWKKRRSISSADDHLLPHEKVFLEIDRLRKQKLLERGEHRKYYFFLSEILRRYIWESFHYPAPDKTTPEILPDLTSIFHDPDLQQLASGFLKRADLVKFANFTPSLEEGVKDTEDLLSLVRISVERLKEASKKADNEKEQAV
jgi:hypothetical protein